MSCCRGIGRLKLKLSRPRSRGSRRMLTKVRRDTQLLQANEAMLEDMLRETRGEPVVKMRAPRSNVKQAVLDLLVNVGAQGLNAAKAVEMAAADGVALDRGSVSSLLSRLKNEKVVEYNQQAGLYRLISFQDAATIHPLRTSGAAT